MENVIMHGVRPPKMRGQRAAMAALGSDTFTVSPIASYRYNLQQQQQQIHAATAKHDKEHVLT